MIIYKITNKTTGKIYIGQTIRTLEQRWKRHISDALNNILDTHFARAIRTYGPDDFEIEQIDTAETQEELTLKEHNWIVYYNSIENGYNETDSIFKSGGNTYFSKTEEEMNIIKEKIRMSKMGEKNPNATGVKCKNIITGEEHFFGSQADMQRFFNEGNHQFCSKRCRGLIKMLYKNEWLIAYANSEYPIDYTIQNPDVNNNYARVGTNIEYINLITNEKRTFKSYREAEQFLPINRKKISEIAQGKRPQERDFIIKLI